MPVNKNIIKNIPDKPGAYLFKNQKNQVLYIGKAKNLKKRISSYFQKTNTLAQDKQKMINLSSSLDYIITRNEVEALLLESNLIKQHRPKYNIILKDDKNYKYIKIDYQDDFPKIYSVRKIEKGPAQYFGPFTDGYAINQTLDLLQKIFRYRDCAKDLNKKFKQRACLKFHIKRCLAPCIGKVSIKEYNQTIHNCELFLKGKQKQVIKDLEQQMHKYSLNKNFEQAAIIRDRLNDVKKIIKKQIVISTKQENEDYISLFKPTSETAIINLFIVREGKLIGKKNFSLKINPKNINSEILSSFIKQYYHPPGDHPQGSKQNTDKPQELILPEKIIDQDLINSWLKIKIIIPKIGKKKQLLDLGIKNAQEYYKRKPISIINDKSIILKNIQLKLNLLSLPHRIECYDISNIQGKQAVGSMAVFVNGLPDKKEYRKFKIKTIFKANDIAMIQEVLNRRIHNNWPEPDLIIIDGGKPQLNAAQKILSEHNWSTPIIALAKKFEKIYTFQNSKPIQLPKDSKELHLLQQIRDEAHRFAISYHKKLRAKTSLKSALDSIKGLGPKSKQALLIKFNSLDNIKKASEQKLAKIVNKKIVQQIKKLL